MDFEIWNYPNVDTLNSLDTPEETPEFLTENNEAPAAPSPESEPLYVETQELLNYLKLAQSITLALTNQLQQVNETFLNQTSLLIKKITEAVILKELSLDKERLKQMIEKALIEIHQDNEPCTIYVSNEQLEFLQSHLTNYPDLTIKADLSLQLGDFKIKTAVHMVESILENRLNEIFELHHG